MNQADIDLLARGVTQADIDEQAIFTDFEEITGLDEDALLERMNPGFWNESEDACCELMEKFWSTLEAGRVKEAVEPLGLDDDVIERLEAYFGVPA